MQIPKPRFAALHTWSFAVTFFLVAATARWDSWPSHDTGPPPPHTHNPSGLLTYPCVVNKMLSLIPVCVFCKRSWFSRHLDLHNGDLSDDREDVGSQSGAVVITCSGKKEWDVIRFLFFANFIWTSFRKNHFAAKRSCEQSTKRTASWKFEKLAFYSATMVGALRGRKK